MSEPAAARGLRQGLLGLAALTAVGTGLELVLLEHAGSPPQVVPFVAMGLGLVAVAAGGLAPSRRTVWSLRGAAVMLVLAGALGVFEHLEHNYAFEAEIRPTEEPAALMVHAIQGASPALAPGAVALMGLIAGLATYRHPALG